MAFLVAGTQSGCGKTTVTLALMQHLRAAGMRIAPFKAGPDFLDPMWHRAVCKRDSCNLDTRMMGEDECRRVFAAQSHDADVAIIEGVMGLFDGVSGVGGAGSSAHLAKALETPVLLVVNAKGMSGSIVPLVEGFVRRAGSMDVRITGVIANRVGSRRHAGLLRELLTDHALPPLMGWMEKDSPTLTERHLGLVMPDETRLPDFSDCFHMDENVFTTKAQRHKEEKTVADSESPRLYGKTIAVARDESFCFIYPANIEWLETQGADVVFFSPLAGETVPESADALWLPGGYPELHAEALSGSSSLESLRKFVETGRPALAECGGMMVLGRGMITTEAQRHRAKHYQMAGVLPCRFVMQDKLAGLGYREEVEGVRGHEFHHSRREEIKNTETQRHRGKKDMNFSPAFELMRGDQGVRYKNLRASYIHWYFPSAPDVVAEWLSGRPIEAQAHKKPVNDISVSPCLCGEAQ